MSQILFAWELGHGYGHIAGFLPLARRLRRRGHTVTFVLKDLSRADPLLPGDEFATLQAPVWYPEATGLPPAVNYAEILFRFGYLTSEGLGSMVRAWRTLFEALAPDLLILDHAPTALLASRGLKIRRALFGHGFFSPPRIHPMPSIRPGLDVPLERLRSSEQRAVDVMNAVLEPLQGPPLRVLADLFTVDEDFLCTFAELDHYADRAGARYWGPRFGATEGAVPAWPSGAGDRIFAYLSADHPDFEKLLQHFAEGPYRVLVHASGADERVLRRHRAPPVAFSPVPVQMARATAECDLVVCHAGGTVAASLLAGRPLLLMPVHLEQSLTARNVVNLGAGVSVGENPQNTSYRRILTQLLGDSAYREQARSFARRYADFSQDRQLERIAERCEDLIAGRPVMSGSDSVDAWR